MIDENGTTFAWEMEPHEAAHLWNLPEIVDLWRVRPDGSDDDASIFYLSEARGVDGQRAMAHGGVVAHLERVTIRSEYVLAVDIDRQTAQVVDPAHLIGAEEDD